MPTAWGIATNMERWPAEIRETLEMQKFNETQHSKKRVTIPWVPHLKDMGREGTPSTSAMGAPFQVKDHR
jgi:hypothetical protein